MTDKQKLLELAERIERYDPKLSPDNRGEELELHRDIVLATGEGGMNPAFEAAFVRSLDTAITLLAGLPKGSLWTLESAGERVVATALPYTGNGWFAEIDASEAATPALALCAAALRARSINEGQQS